MLNCFARRRKTPSRVASRHGGERWPKHHLLGGGPRQNRPRSSVLPARPANRTANSDERGSLFGAENRFRSSEVIGIHTAQTSKHGQCGIFSRVTSFSKTLKPYSCRFLHAGASRKKQTNMNDLGFAFECVFAVVFELIRVFSIFLYIFGVASELLVINSVFCLHVAGPRPMLELHADT